MKWLFSKQRKLIATIDFPKLAGFLLHYKIRPSLQLIWHKKLVEKKNAATII